jgi:hypothetical protein
MNASTSVRGFPVCRIRPEPSISLVRFHQQIIVCRSPGLECPILVPNHACLFVKRAYGRHTASGAVGRAPTNQVAGTDIRFQNKWSRGHAPTWNSGRWIPSNMPRIPPITGAPEHGISAHQVRWQVSWAQSPVSAVGRRTSPLLGGFLGNGQHRQLEARGKFPGCRCSIFHHQKTTVTDWRTAC